MNAKVVIIILTAALASLLEIIDSSIVNVAIPTMMGNLGVTLDEISWVSTGYMIANSIVLPIAAWLGMSLGRKLYFTSAILLFTVASFLCGMAPNLPLLIVFRIFQGLAGGALLPTSQTLIQEQFPREKAGMASAVFGMSVMIGPALGPTLGGYLTDHFGWRMIFNINVPVGIIAALMSWFNVDNVANTNDVAPGTKKKALKVDWLGLFFLSVGVGCFQFIMERGETEGWLESNLIRACAVCSIVGVVSFIIWELKISNPIMNLRLFKNNIVRSGTLLMLALGVMLYALTFVVPIFANRVIHLTATQTGELFIPGAILTAFAMLGAGFSLKFINPKHLVFVGMIIAEVALLQMSHFTTATGASDLYYPLILRGLALGCLFIPINGMVLGAFRGEELGQVAGMMNFFRQIGGSMGIASLSTILTQFSAQNYLELMRHVSALNPVAFHDYMNSQGLPTSRLASEIGLGPLHDLGVKSLYGRAQEQVFLLSFNQLCWVIMFIFALAIIPLFTMKSQSKITKPVLDAH